MKLDCLNESLASPVIRLYDFTEAEAAQFLFAVMQLSSSLTERVELHRLPFIEPIHGCCLSLVCRTWDQAVTRLGPSEFECGFTAAIWDNVAGLIEPFACDAQGHQWLAGAPGEASVLFSASGEW